MQTIVLTEPFRLDMEERPQPVPGPGEALVRVCRIGICGTDLHAFEGKQPYFTYPRILGHELSVEIVEIGENRRGLNTGDRCVVNPYLACGRCIACRNDKPNCCAALAVLGVHVDGGMAEYMTIPGEALVPATDLTLEEMALVENQCIGAHAVGRAGVGEGEHVLVLGAGPIGLGVIQFAKLRGAKVLVADIVEERLAFCRKHLIVEGAWDAREGLLDRVRSATSGDMAAVVFDATGNPTSMAEAYQYVAHGGRLVLVGLVQDRIAFPDPEFHKREMTLLGSRNATNEDFETVINSLAGGRASVKPFITHRTAFQDVPKEFPQWLAPDAGVVKAVVEVHGT